jgi:hypothetical protein
MAMPDGIASLNIDVTRALPCGVVMVAGIPSLNPMELPTAELTKT